MKLTDDELMADLGRIDDEVKRRKAARSFEPYAQWALWQRLDAMARLNERLTRTKDMRTFPP